MGPVWWKWHVRTNGIEHPARIHKRSRQLRDEEERPDVLAVVDDLHITSEAAITHKGQWPHDGTDEMVDKHGDAKKHVEMKEH